MRSVRISGVFILCTISVSISAQVDGPVFGPLGDVPPDITYKEPGPTKTECYTQNMIPKGECGFQLITPDTTLPNNTKNLAMQNLIDLDNNSWSKREEAKTVLIALCRDYPAIYQLLNDKKKAYSAMPRPNLPREEQALWNNMEVLTRLTSIIEQCNNLPPESFVTKVYERYCSQYPGKVNYRCSNEKKDSLLKSLLDTTKKEYCRTPGQTTSTYFYLDATCTLKSMSFTGPTNKVTIQRTCSCRPIPPSPPAPTKTPVRAK